MKFGKVLKVSSENMPEEMHDLFLRYKELKKQIKLIPVGKDAAASNEKQASVSPDGSVTGSGSTGQAIVTATVLSPEEQAFITTLNEDLARFNRYFIEKEEEAVIRIQALCDELTAAAAAAGFHLPAALTDVTTTLSDHEEGRQHVVAVVPSYGQAAVADSSAAAAAPPAAQPAAQPAAVTDSSAGARLAALAPASAAESDPGEATRRQAAAATPQQQQQEQQQRQPEQPEQPGSHNHHHNHQHGSHHNGHGHPGSSALQAVKSRLVQFHGEMVLLLHWSLLNYAAVVKILKKHDKRTGVLLRAPYLANVLQQPFSSTTIMSRLAKRAEELVVATMQLGSTGLHGSAPVGTPAVASGRAEGAAGASAPQPAAAAAQIQAQTDRSGLPRGSTEAQQGQTWARAVAAAPSGRGAASASEASTLTFATAVDRDGAYGDATCHTEPLVGSTMHALETWANLRKNAITPSTVLAAEVEQPPQQQQQQQQQLAQQQAVLGKRKAEDAAAEDTAPGQQQPQDAEPGAKSPRRRDAGSAP